MCSAIDVCGVGWQKPLWDHCRWQWKRSQTYFSADTANINHLYWLDLLVFSFCHGKQVDS